MRAKLPVSRRTGRRSRRGTTHPQESTADWIVENELGWGVPHGLVLLGAAILVGGRALRWELSRAVAWLERRARSGPRG